MLRVHAIRGFDRAFEGELDLAFRFRHTAFVQEAGWHNLNRADGLEIDQFDTDDTIHVVVIDDGRVRAYSRLNPTTKSHMLPEVYPHLAAQPIPRDHRTWEWSRMGTAKQARTDGRGWSGPIGLLLRCVSHTAFFHGIGALVWQAHPTWISRACQLGFNPRPLGFPHLIGGEKVIAAVMEVGEEVFPVMDEHGVPGLPRFIASEPRREAA